MRRSRLVGFVAPLLLALGLGFTQAASAQAASNSGGYVALGDSYASGVGAGSYISSSGDCDRSTNSAAYLWNAAHKPTSFAFNACSGATTDDVMANQLGSLNSSTSLVSISIGGNDAGFASVMQTCVLNSDSTCLSAIASAKSYITNTLPGKLDTVYNAIHSKAPNARVVVVGYPRFYLLGQVCLGLSDTKRSAINGAADTLDSTIQSRVSAHGFAFGDVRSAFSSHEICSSSSWLHSLNVLDLTESYHPTADGQSGGYLPALTNAAG
ncbi:MULTISPECIES: SGNH/GDSL hydrolase family protein [Streptomyces]|uniref:Lysophospholipase L1-like esterase n=1 Tax=Streptomyces murinus TaxID=33900 RepID=A0A7W3RKT7_STRMR|nr:MULTISPECIES: SGNH/GDSL hydrolase family protein [Streptomyces]MBA9052738.1 lysophospholipase L1-like esterase [Streptomyces murinus]UWW93939.1 lipase [Streptomyces murinus]WSI84646.1 SGNH/GDSL hydrolase family protein [Streptomyces murinus]WUD06354.1 SGNH/GDSL hydrolase family protein [Streptomyces murinus]